MHGAKHARRWKEPAGRSPTYLRRMDYSEGNTTVVRHFMAGTVIEQCTRVQLKSSVYIPLPETPPPCPMLALKHVCVSAARCLASNQL